jgi:hypothetical protein
MGRSSPATVFEHVTFGFVGRGFAGLTTGARLAEAGVLGRCFVTCRL